MFSLNSSNNLLPEKHSSLSPKMSKHMDTGNETIDSQGRVKERDSVKRKYHSSLNKKSEKRQKVLHKMSSPLIRNDAAEDPTGATLEPDRDMGMQELQLSQATFNARKRSKINSGDEDDALVYTDYKQQEYSAIGRNTNLNEIQTENL